MATENRDWGYTRIIGALSNLGHNLARGTVADILKRNRAGTRTRPKDDVERIPDPTLGSDRGS
jgi:hypothetical protein